MFARPLIDSVDFARNGKELHGKVGLAEMLRLADVVLGLEGDLRYSVQGSLEGGRDILNISLHGSCILRCQRCLGEMHHPIDVNSRLWLLPADRLNEVEEDDDVDVIEMDSKLDIITLMEDELLLGLPFAPRHPEGACVLMDNVADGNSKPFAALAKLKK